MKITFDARYNIAYLQLREKKEQVDSIKVSEELVIDMAKDGTIYGIEMLNAREQLQETNSLHMLLVNAATGEEREMTV